MSDISSHMRLVNPSNAPLSIPEMLLEYSASVSRLFSMLNPDEITQERLLPANSMLETCQSLTLIPFQSAAREVHRPPVFVHSEPVVLV